MACATRNRGRHRPFPVGRTIPVAAAIRNLAKLTPPASEFWRIGLLARTSRGSLANMQLSSRARRSAPALLALAALAVTPTFDRQTAGSDPQPAGSAGPLASNGTHHQNLRTGSGHPRIEPV